MNDINTAEETTVECTDEAIRDILTGRQAAIFRDIWRLHDVDAALKMLCTMQRALPDDLDRSDTPNLNNLASLLRNAPDTMHYLEFTIGDPRIAFGVLRFQEQHNRLATENRASKAAEGAAAQPQQKGGKQA